MKNYTPTFSKAFFPESTSLPEMSLSPRDIKKAANYLSMAHERGLIPEIEFEQNMKQIMAVYFDQLLKKQFSAFTKSLNDKAHDLIPL